MAPAPVVFGSNCSLMPSTKAETDENLGQGSSSSSDSVQGSDKPKITRKKIEKKETQVRELETSRMSNEEIKMAQRFYDETYHFQTIQDLKKIAGPLVVKRFCKLMKVNTGEGDNARDFKMLKKNVENKLRRLPLWQARYHDKIQKKMSKKLTGYEKKRDEKNLQKLRD